MLRENLTEQEWREIGASLKAIRNEALVLYGRIANALPKKHKGRKKLDKAVELLTGAKYWLEGEMLKQHPNLRNDPSFVKVFYGPDQT